MFRDIRSLRPGALWLGLCLIAAGCQRGPQVINIDGLVTCNEKPVPYLFLNFIPEEGRPSWGITDEEGKFKLSYDETRDGAIEGKHKVSVAFRPRSPKEEYEIQSGARKLHPQHKSILAKYGDPRSTPIEVEVKDANQKVHLKLQVD